MAPHSSTLAWKIPWTEEPGRLQSMGSLRVGHNWATSLSLFTFIHWRRKWQPAPVFLPRESRGRGSLVGCRVWDRTELDTTEVTWHSITYPHSGGGLVTKSCPTLATPWTVACWAPLTLGLPRQQYWSGLPFPSPENLPNPGIKPTSPVLQVDSLPPEPPGKPSSLYILEN